MSPSDDDEPITISRPALHRGQHNEAARDIYGAGRDMQLDGSSGQHVHVNVNLGGAAPEADDASRKDEPRSAPSGEQAGRAPGPGTGSHRGHGPRRPWLLAAAATGAAAALLIGFLVIHGVGAHSREPGLSRSGRSLVTTVQMAGSGTFFSDPSVERELQRQGFAVQTSSLGSRQICTEPKVITTYDISESGSREAATCVEDLVQKAGKTPDVASPYDGLMVIITYKPIVGLLEQLHVASEANGITVFDVAKYLKAFASGKRWTDIRGNTTYPSHNRILLWTTDPKQSNSSGMLADIAYSAQIRGDTPTSIGARDPHVPVIKSLFTELGSLESHTPVLLNKFLTGGMGAYPMAMVYESDYLGAVLTGETHDPNLTVMYPTPDVLAEDTLVAWTPAGKQLIDLLQSPAMAAPEQAHGYRTEADKAGFVKYMASKHIIVPDLDQLEKTLQFTNLPTEDVLEKLIHAVAPSQPS
jgi:hypothetical protein